MAKRIFYIHPITLIMIGIIMVGIAVVILGLTMDSKRSEFEQACTMMGGVPLIGNSGTKICFKSDVVLSVN